jgi:hypothetical protein
MEIQPGCPASPECAHHAGVALEPDDTCEGGSEPIAPVGFEGERDRFGVLARPGASRRSWLTLGPTMARCLAMKFPWWGKAGWLTRIVHIGQL